MKGSDIDNIVLWPFSYCHVTVVNFEFTGWSVVIFVTKITCCKICIYNNQVNSNVSSLHYPQNRLFWFSYLKQCKRLWIE